MSEIIYSIQPRSHVRSFSDLVVVVVTVAVDICGSGRGTNSGVGAVELPAMPRQKVVDQLVDTGWIEKSTYFPHRDLALPYIVGPNEGLCRVG